MGDNQTRFPVQARALLRLGLPLVGSNLAQVGLHVTDTVMMGWYSVPALAAVVLGASSFFILFILGSGFGVAVMPMVASADGDEVETRRATRMGLWLSLLYSALVLPVFWYAGPIFIALGQTPETAATAQSFMRIAGFGMAPALFVMVLKSFLAALERTHIVLWATLAGVVMNATLNWAFIFGHWGAPEMGAAGSATATLGTQILTLIVVAAYALLHPKLRHFQLATRFWRPDWQYFFRVFRLGYPIGLTSVSEGGLFQATAIMMGWIGTVQLAAHGIALELASITFMVHLGLSQAATVRVGRAHGRRALGEMRAAALAATGLSLVFAAVCVTIFLTLPKELIGLYIRPGDPLAPQILAFGSRLLLVAALFQVADASQVMALGLLRGVQDTRVPMWMAGVSYWCIGIPASYVLAFPLHMGGTGLWLGLVVGLVAAASLMMTRFWLGPARLPGPAARATS
ncbi:MATE family efflux transporter [Solirhodobacter olei]|uniref:MATE family efflux transporter n=1 Tax=Solirhodobacter olei TaxID=2493082 RepID=UPI000FDB1267|nr:MATE family efflux transporter [Solirhodobacter olei]